MKVLCLARGYASYGASILTSAAEHLEATLKDVEPKNLAIEVIAFIRHEGPPKRTLEGRLEQHILQFPEQVRARYRAKVGKLNLEYPSSLSESESFARSAGIYAVAHVLPRALEELSDAVWPAIEIGHLEGSGCFAPHGSDRKIQNLPASGPRTNIGSHAADGRSTPRIGRHTEVC